MVTVNVVVSCGKHTFMWLTSRVALQEFYFGGAHCTSKGDISARAVCYL